MPRRASVPDTWFKTCEPEARDGLHAEPMKAVTLYASDCSQLA